uniref:Uncharacterized protein n=1 Tax=Hyaloperonospora arabidopsidis (strain Emoy2) TaxID=559515 RepID=M4BMW7_HYAAE
MIQVLEIFWMQQANREDQIMRTLQQMKDKITAIRTRQKVGTGTFYRDLLNT